MPRPRKQLPIAIERKIRELADEGFSPSQIWRYVGEDKVDLKTVQRRVKEYAAPDTSGVWSLADAEPEDARLVLEVYAEVVARTAGRAWITRALADWIVRVRRAAPSLPPYNVYVVAREYRRAAAKQDTKHIRALDAFLAFHPWESGESADRYEALLAAGIVGQPIYIGKWWRDISPAKPMTSDEIAKAAAAFDQLEELIRERKLMRKEEPTNER